MYSFTIAASGSPDSMWSRYLASIELDAASAALDSADVALVSLTVDTEWAADGVRALHQLLGDFDERGAVEARNVAHRRSELGKIDAA